MVPFLNVMRPTAHFGFAEAYFVTAPVVEFRRFDIRVTRHPLGEQASYHGKKFLSGPIVKVFPCSGRSGTPVERCDCKILKPIAVY
jgi:hypothetical protein